MHLLDNIKSEQKYIERLSIANSVEDKVLILARTRMSNNKVCVGGCLLSSNQYVRLLSIDEKNIDSTEPYQVGQVYNITFDFRNILYPPHVEDVIVINKTYVRKMSDLEFFSKIRELDLGLGYLENLFSSCLKWSEGHAFLLRDNIPNYSVLITSLKYDLRQFENNPRYFCIKLDNIWHKIRYVGDHELPSRLTISSGTPIRFSLARWWTGHGYVDKFNNPQERSYLQISGFYRCNGQSGYE